jgi:flagellar FliL protein
MDKVTQQVEKSGGKRLVPLALLAVGLLVGTTAGAVVAGPLLGGGEAQAAAPEDGGAGSAADGAEESGAGDDATAEPAGKYVVEDLVLNPAGTGGTRFLMASVAFRLGSAEAEARLEGRDEEVRDVILGVLGNKTVEELVRPDSARAALKAELRDSVAGLFPKGTVQRVYLPKFVVQ